MKYKCIIIDVQEDVVTILVNNTEITGLSNRGTLLDIGVETEVEISFFDDIKIFESNQKKACMHKKGDSLSYSIIGILNVEKVRIESLVNFNLELGDLFNYSFLDGKMVEVEVVRINLEFIES